MTLSCTLSCVVSPREKEKKININNDLAVLPSHDNQMNTGLRILATALLLPQTSCFLPNICT